ncbi:MAG: hypothetical protein J7463_00575 [Roseiflexus sp.]|jgi:hypothetical protein|nr:hypothetical protein [Roseiflexus sp.]MBO9333325.1 hypothetical protein [Roseiflexus sp.]MBO9341899.1 hypothetical protein [Roseiflexus sp.]MBO9366711.1 hypothetical protein [Roseiflexus sp.]MBO9383360.1 hypothetical protein [Roseiflexus sp.]
MNPILAHLGFRPEERVIIIHADDLSMCQATILPSQNFSCWFRQRQR